MKKVIVLVAALCWSLSVASAQEPAPSAGAQMEWTGSVDQKVWGLMVVWSEAKYAFPFFDRIPDIDWDAKVREYIPRAIAAPDIDAYYNVSMEFAALLHDGHTAST